MSPRNPEHVDPRRLSEQGQVVTGTYELQELPRLAPVLSDSSGEAEFEFRFSRDASRRPLIEGRVRASLNLVCQRCLEHYAMPVDSEFALVQVQGLDEAEALPADVDPLMPEDAVIHLRDLVEEELLLAVPVVPKHPHCEVRTESGDEQNAEAETVEPDRENPFQVLAALKEKELDD